MDSINILTPEGGSTGKARKTARKQRSAVLTLSADKSDFARTCTNFARHASNTAKTPKAVPTLKKPEKRQFSNFEDYRAQLLHEFFTLVAAGMQKGFSPWHVYHAEWRQYSRKKFKGRKVRLSQSSFYRLFTNWNRHPRPATVKRKYSIGHRVRTKRSQSVIQAAIALRVPVREALSNMDNPPCSARTVFRHFREHTKILTKLVRLERKEKHLAAKLASLPVQ